MREVLSVLVGALLLTPVAIGGVQLATDLRAEPRARIHGSSTRGRVDVPVDAGPGSEFELDAPGSARGVAYLTLIAATFATQPRATIDVCVRDACREERVSAPDGALVVLSVPAEPRGAPVRVRVEDVHGGRLAFWGGPGAPAVTWLRRGSWAELVAHASEYARAFGVRSFPAWLRADAALLLAIALGALGALGAGARRARPRAGG